MFKTLPNGIEIYFSWPFRTARVVPNKRTKNEIRMRDSLMFAFVAFWGFTAALLREPSPIIGVTMGLLFLVGLLERSRYLSRLQKIRLEVTTDGSGNRLDQTSRYRGEPNTAQISGAEINTVYIAERSIFDGVLVMVLGAAMTAFMAYLLVSDTDIPLAFKLPLIVGAVVLMYVGYRILAGKIGGQLNGQRRSE
jgi:hypothetical protein